MGLNVPHTSKAEKKKGKGGQGFFFFERPHLLLRLFKLEVIHVVQRRGTLELHVHVGNKNNGGIFLRLGKSLPINQKNSQERNLEFMILQNLHVRSNYKNVNTSTSPHSLSGPERGRG